VELSRKGIANTLRGLKQKWGSASVKRDMWNKEYEAGKWKHCEVTPRAHVYELVERYCRRGAILDLGCGSGNTGNEIDLTKYRDYVGVDISTVAVRRAIERSEECGRSSKNTYVQGDIESYSPDRKYDVILFRESIYYLALGTTQAALDRYRRYLADDNGVFIVNMSRLGSKHFGEIARLLEANYLCVEKSTPDHDTYVLVFR